MADQPPDPAHARRVPSPTRAVERALSLLAEVCSAPVSLSLADCARRVDLAPSTALRLLRTLEAAEFVARDARGSFHAGPRLIQLGATALGRDSLALMAEPSLRRLVAASGESVYVSVPGPGQTALYVGRAEGTHPVRHAAWIGSTVPLDGTAVGAALRGEVPEGGYVVRASSVEEGVTAIAAPIRRPSGMAGALSLVGPGYRIDGEKSRALGALVAREARAIAGRYGMVPAGPAGAAGGAGPATGPDASNPGNPADVEVAEG